MKCSKCGAENPDDTVFCVSCGARAEAPAESCPKCQAPVKPGAAFCPNCGAAVAKNAVPAETVCPQCSAPVKPDAVFCPSCGSKLQGAAPAPVQPVSPFAPRPAGNAPAPYAAPANAPYAPPAYAAPYANPYVQPLPQGKPRRKGKGLLITIAVILVLALAGAGIFALFGNSIKRIVMGPKASYLSIEGKALKQDAADLAANLAEYGSQANKPAKGGHNFALQFDLNESALGIDAATAAALENITIHSRLVYDRSGTLPKYFNKLDLSVETESLLTMETYYDQDQIIVGFPAILSKSIVASANEMTSLMGSAGMDSSQAESVQMLTGLLAGDLGVDETKLKGTLNKMVDSMLDNIDSAVFLAGQPLKVGTVTANYDLYTVTIKKEGARKMLLEIFGDLKNDKEFYYLFSQLASYSAISSGTGATAMTYEDYKASLDTLIAELEADNSSEDFTIVQKVYVDKNNAVFGRDITIKNAGGTEQMHFLYAHPVSGSKEAVDIKLEVNQEIYEFTSAYTLSSGKKTGVMTLTTNGTQVLTASFKDLLSKKVGSTNRLLGTIELTFQDTSSLGSTVTAPTGINFTGSEGKTTYDVKIEIPNMLGLDISYNEIAAADVSIPAYKQDSLVSASDDAAIQALMTPEVQKKFMAIVEQLGLTTITN